MILARIRAGDRKAFECLVGETWDPLIDHLTWVLGSREAAEDAGQEAFIRIWEQRERWRAELPMTPLQRVARWSIGLGALFAAAAATLVLAKGAAATFESDSLRLGFTLLLVGTAGPRPSCGTTSGGCGSRTAKMTQQELAEHAE